MYQVGDKIQHNGFLGVIQAEVLSVDRHAQLVWCRIINSAEVGPAEYSIPFEFLKDWEFIPKIPNPLGGWLPADPECRCDVKALLSFGHEATCAYLRSRK